jgi:hypothetical protein
MWAPTTTLRALNIFSETLYEECSYYFVQTWYCTVHFVCTGIYFLLVMHLALVHHPDQREERPREETLR